MKKILIICLVLIGFQASSQNLDTVLVRNLQLQAQDWAWLVGSQRNQNTDSLSIVAFRYIRTKIRAANPPAWTTNVTIDSLPGFIVLDFYKAVKTANAGEIVSRYTPIVNSISGKVNLSYWIGFIDGNLNGDFNRKRDLGKYLVMDN